MKPIYAWFGGRKVFIFFVLLIINTILAVTGKFDDKFGDFCIYLYGVIVVGNVASKIGRKNE